MDLKKVYYLCNIRFDKLLKEFILSLVMKSKSNQMDLQGLSFLIHIIMKKNLKNVFNNKLNNKLEIIYFIDCTFGLKDIEGNKIVFMYDVHDDTFNNIIRKDMTFLELISLNKITYFSYLNFEVVDIENNDGEIYGYVIQK